MEEYEDDYSLSFDDYYKKHDCDGCPVNHECTANGGPGGNAPCRDEEDFETVSDLIEKVKISSCRAEMTRLAMENEEIFQKEIASKRAHISAQQEIISKLENEKRDILKKIKSFENKNLTRDEKIIVLDLDMKLYKIDEDLQKVEGEIAEYEKKILDHQKRIDEIINSPFKKRLLRQ